jgi:hypothetical protein
MEDPSLQSSSPASSRAPATVIWYDFDKRKSNQGSSPLDEIQSISHRVTVEDSDSSARSTPLAPDEELEDMDSRMANSLHNSHVDDSKYTPQHTEVLESHHTAVKDHLRLQQQSLSLNSGERDRGHHFLYHGFDSSCGGAVSPKRVEVNSRCIYNLLPVGNSLRSFSHPIFV